MSKLLRSLNIRDHVIMSGQSKRVGIDLKLRPPGSGGVLMRDDRAHFRALAFIHSEREGGGCERPGFECRSQGRLGKGHGILNIETERLKIGD